MPSFHRVCSRTVVAALSVCACCTAAEAANEQRTFEIYGFAMADLIFDTGRVDPDWQDAFRPSKIATFDGEFGKDGQSSLSVKQSRIGFKGVMPLPDDDPIIFKFEIDMFGVGVDAGQTTIRLRHAYGEWGPLLAGQTHSLFMDIDVFPNTIDYWGPAGMVFFRLPQIRWTIYRDDESQLAIAVEKPGNDVDPGHIREIDPSLTDIRGSEELPDLTASWRFNGDWGHFQIAGILRRIGFETFDTVGNEPSGTETGWGVNVSGHLNLFERDRMYGQVVYGEGIASYMNDGGTDLAPGGSILFPTAETVPLLGVVAWYDHYWDEQWSTSFGYSFTEVDNTSLQLDDAFHEGEYAAVNLLYAPHPSILIGGELLWGDRENNDGTDGDDVRFQFSVKYSFGTKIIG